MFLVLFTFTRKDDSAPVTTHSMALQADVLRVPDAMWGLFCPGGMEDKGDVTSHLADSLYRITQQLLSPVFSRFL